MITILLVRHADINLPPVAGSDNPPLNSAGQARAETLAHVAEAAGVITIFTSSFTRTKQTAEPLAAKLGIQPREVPSLPVLAREVLSGTVGVVALIVGHSNTIPQSLKINRKGCGSKDNILLSCVSRSPHFVLESATTAIDFQPLR